MATNGNGNGINGVNGKNGFIDKDGFTKLDWKDYQKKANELIQDLPHGKDWQAEIVSKLGKGAWEFEDQGVVTYNLNRTTNKKTGKWNIKRKRDSVRAQHLQKAADTRNTRLENANVVMGDEAIEAGKVKQKEIQAKAGRNADHILEVQTFGPAQELLEEELAKGAITQAEYNKRLQILKDSNIGDSAENFQDLSESANQAKKNEVYAKNKSLEKLEKANPSTRHLDEKYVKAMGLANDYKVTKFAKAIRAIKPLGVLVPVVGSGILSLDVKARTDEAIANPTWQNKTQAALGGVELALEGFELATGGAGAVVTTPLQIGLMIADQAIHQTEPEFKRAPRNWQARLDARRGKR
jgi:hypothetical protein|tara:strand:- start:201 stop:1259 length:1059 start_codon:yes stop_codon:yes gene_type:complete